MTRVLLSGGRVEEVADAESAHRICQEPKRGWEKLWQFGSERLNPILVKEVRQSLKSRQFEISFGLILLAAIGWTLLYIALSVPRIYYMPGGAELLSGYAMILLVPLQILIPFGAFRSLTSEIEESTYELLSISNLSARQIVTGKMATAALQILLYISALGPCIVLTYMLRGVSLVSVLVLLFAAVAYSVMLVSCALVLATVSRTRAGQSGLSVGLLAILVISFFASVMSVLEGILREVVSTSLAREVFIGLFAAVTILAATFSLLMQTAAAAIDFPSENKSTPIRKRLLVLISVLVFWLMLATFALGENAGRFAAEIYQPTLFMFFMVWMAIGGLICGERGVISPRARRTLPKTFAGRVVLTWLSPGAGLGYGFLVVVFASVAMLLAGITLYVRSSQRLVSLTESTAVLAVVLTSYLAFYVGLCRLIMLAVGRKIANPMLASVALLIVLLLVIQLVPYFLVLYWNDFTTVAYAWHQTFNIYMTMEAVVDGIWTGFLGNLIALALAALAVFGLNLMLSTRDVMIVRMVAPQRVQQELAVASAEPPASIDPFLS
ncbi:MAG: ABC transporter permease [Aureliella sp.]